IRSNPHRSAGESLDPGSPRGDPVSMGATTRVLVCDDHTLLRAGLRRLLEAHPGVEVTGEASNAEEAVEQAAALQPNVVLLDIVMPGRSGIEALPDVRAAAPEA